MTETENPQGNFQIFEENKDRGFEGRAQLMGRGCRKMMGKGVLISLSRNDYKVQ